MAKFSRKHTRWVIALLPMFTTYAALASDEQESCYKLELAFREAGAPSGLSLAKRCFAEGSDLSVSQALELAIDYRHEDITLELVNKTERLTTDREMILLASAMELPRVVAVLLQKDPSLANAKGEYGLTPLKAAARGGAYMVAQVLLENGADPNLGNPLLSAVIASRVPIAYLLMENGASLKNLPNDRDGSLIGAAARYTDEAFIHYLLNNGGDLNQRDSEGHTALLYTLHHSHERVGERNWVYLVNHGADPLTLICRLTTDQEEHFREFAPKWFLGQLDIYRPQCDRKTAQ